MPVKSSPAIEIVLATYFVETINVIGEGNTHEANKKAPLFSFRSGWGTQTVSLVSGDHQVNGSR